MTTVLLPTLFDFALTEIAHPDDIVSREDADSLFSFFKSHPLFNWKDSHNGCEARADAVCVLLDQWHIPHYKAWVFGGDYLKKHIGGLKQNWNYHVAPLLQVLEGENIMQYILDPATADTLQLIDEWASGVTAYPHSYHFIKLSHWYIFNERKITSTNWYSRNRQNRKWMLQGLAGIYSLSATGKAQLCFNKGRLKNTAAAFKKLQTQNPLASK